MSLDVYLGAEKIISGLRLIQADNRIDLHCRLYANAAADEIERLRKIEAAARALKFSGYPAHGSGFTITVTGGNIDELKAVLAETK